MNLDTILPHVKKPGQYIGKEFNRIVKDWENAQVRMALVFPDRYEIGMSHQGLQILYHIVNGRKEYLAERAYVPDLDMEDLLRKNGIPLFSLESKKPLKEFDVVGITLPYELCYANILTILDLAGMPFRAKDRDASCPLVIGGGPCSFNPEPVADFFDAILLGDGEEAILEIAEVVQKAKIDKVDKAELLDRLHRITGLYVPSMFESRYDAQGNFKEIVPHKEGCERVKKRILADLEKAEGIITPLVPLTKIVHDRLGVEIARGCTRGCRFCQAGIIYRPVRERSPDRVMELARNGIAGSGFDELALLSLSTGDYSCLSQVMIQLMNTFAAQKVSVSMPSMRVGTLTPDIMEQIRRVRKTGFTVAPEAGSERLRQVINKGITETDLLETCKAAFDLGWRRIKFYFMIGLPTETMDDVEAIAELAHKVLNVTGKGKTITVSVGTFVPKAHTPFQREPQLSIEESFAKIDLLKTRLKKRAFTFKWQDPGQSFLEGVMARGDRKLSFVIEAAWRKGARLDGWSDYFNLDTWLHAGQECDTDLNQYLRKREVHEALPWSHLDTGVDESFLCEEHQKALSGEYTPDCRIHGCQKCGLCDFKTLRPITHHTKDRELTEAARTPEPDSRACPSKSIDTEALKDDHPALDANKKTPEQRPGHYVYKIEYSRLGSARYLGHLEMASMFFRLFRRVGMPVNYSQGFNPSPRVSFSPALPLGTESEVEYLLVNLYEELSDPGALQKAMNGQLPDGIRVKEIGLSGSEENIVRETCYEIDLGEGFDNQKLKLYDPAKDLFVNIVRKGRKKIVDAGPLLKDFRVTDAGKVQIVLMSEPGKAGIKPLELLVEILSCSLEELQVARVLKVWSKKSSVDKR